MNDQMPNHSIKAFQYWLEENSLKHRTVLRHIQNIARILAETNAFTKVEIDDYFFRLKDKGCKNTYLNSLICSIRVYARFTENEDLTHFKFRKKEIFSKATMSDEEIQSFLELPAKSVKQNHSISGELMDRRIDPKGYQVWTVFFSIMAFTGMRPGEVANLKSDDIDWGRGVFVITDSKTNTPGVAPISPNIKDMVKRHVDSLPQGKTYLFPSKLGGNKDGVTPVVDNVDWHYNFHTRLKRLGINRTNLTPYSFRHSFATRLLESDVSLFHVKKLMRHHDLKSTLVYEHLTTADLIRAVKKLPMVRIGSDPKGILNDIGEVFEGFELENDSRFTYTLNKTDQSLTIQISIK